MANLIDLNNASQLEIKHDTESHDAIVKRCAGKLSSSTQHQKDSRSDKMMMCLWEAWCTVGKGACEESSCASCFFSAGHSPSTQRSMASSSPSTSSASRACVARAALPNGKSCKPKVDQNSRFSCYHELSKAALAGIYRYVHASEVTGAQVPRRKQQPPSRPCGSETS